MPAVRLSPVRALGPVVVVALAVLVDLLTWSGDRELRGGAVLQWWVLPSATVVVHATLLLRWRHLVAAHVVQWTFALTSLLVPDYQPFAGLLIALHAAASRLPARQSELVLASLAVPFAVHSYNTSARTGSAADFVAIVTLWMLLGLAVWGVGRLSYHSARRAWRLRELQEAAAAEAITAERMRLARELHDIVSHAVTGMMLQATGAQALLHPTDERVRASLSVIEQTGVQAMAELHRMLGLLQSVDPDAAHGPSEPGPAVADIATIVALAEAAGRQVRLVEEGTPGPLDPSVATAAYRIVQESLTNSSKHAGNASTVVIVLAWTSEHLHVVVATSDRGEHLKVDRAAILSSGHGLEGLRERVTLIGGTFTSGPTADGFEVAAQLPRPADRTGPRAAAVLS
jgi:signal transduction histidine kinase